MTYPLLNHARSIIWLVTGADKKPMLGQLLAGNTKIPAGRVSQEQAILVADKAAMDRVPGIRTLECTFQRLSGQYPSNRSLQRT